MKYEKNAIFYDGDNLNSTFFRIPFLMKTANGTTIAGTDVNFGSSGDSAENIKVAIRRRTLQNEQEDYTEGWDPSFIPNAFHFKDFPDKLGYEQESTSFIDGVIAEDTIGVCHKGRLFIYIDANPWNGGMITRMVNRTTVPEVIYNKDVPVEYTYRLGNAKPGDGFATINGKKYWLLSSKNIKTLDPLTNKELNENYIRANFDYLADIYGEKNAQGGYNIYHLVGTPTEYGDTLDDSNLSIGSLSEYSLNENYELMQNGELLYTKQEYTDIKIPLNIMYKNSPLQVFCTTYHYIVVSDDDGVTWKLKANILGMIYYPKAKYFLVGPGRGIQITKGEHRGRIVFPLYFYDDGREKVSTIFSDDGGETFTLGKELNATQSLSESTFIELPNGDLQVFIRNNNRDDNDGRVLTAVTKFGENFIDTTLKTAFGDLEKGVGCQVSGVNLSEKVISKKDGKMYEAVVVSTPNNSNRENGRLHIGLIKEENNAFNIDFEYEYEVNAIGQKYGYSSLCEIRKNVIGLLYEDAPNGVFDDGLHRMMYQEFNINDIIK
ncbi:MAG: sialidase family protein [Clostridia bacterium]